MTTNPQELHGKSVVDMLGALAQTMKQDKLKIALAKKEEVLEHDMRGRWACKDECVTLLIEICMIRSTITHAQYKREPQWLKTFKQNCVSQGKISEEYFEFLESN